jgi:alkaline phosphatase
MEEMETLMRTLIAAAALALLAAAPAQAHPGKAPKNVLFFLADGLGFNTSTAARIYAVGEDGNLTIDTLPESAFVKTYARNAQVTDSAAAMSALMTGVKADFGVVAMRGNSCKDFRPAATLLELAKKRGLAAGIVTNTRITDATPAATYAHACHRNEEMAIAAAMVPNGGGYNKALGKGLDVALGGGAEFFLPENLGGKRTDGRNLMAEMKAQGYTVAGTATELAQAGPGKLLGLFGKSDLAYDAERPPGQPGLVEMTTAAIDRLARHKQGFFLMVEGGLIDFALHDSLGKRALQETVVFDQALKAAIERMQALDPGLRNTLIVVTSDHDHTLLLNGYAKRTGPTTPTQPGVLGLVHGTSDGGVRKDADGMPYTIIGFGNGENRVQGSRASAPALTDAVVARDDYRYEAAIRMPKWEETHGGADVYLGAIGARAERFRGTIDNTEVFKLIKEAAQW